MTGRLPGADIKGAIQAESLLGPIHFRNARANKVISHNTRVRPSMTGYYQLFGIFVSAPAP